MAESRGGFVLLVGIVGTLIYFNYREPTVPVQSDRNRIASPTQLGDSRLAGIIASPEPSSPPPQLDIMIPQVPAPGDLERRGSETYSEFDQRRDALGGSLGRFRGYGCTVNCGGHEAGYRWAEENGVQDEDQCGGNSWSFEEGCRSYAEEQQSQRRSAYSLGSTDGEDEGTNGDGSELGY